MSDSIVARCWTPTSCQELFQQFHGSLGLFVEIVDIAFFIAADGSTDRELCKTV
jgi:hypothetical protein